jgi:tellurite resistance protein TerC
LFVFVIILSYFRIPAARQHRVLLWGVVGAVLFRALFISLGASLLRDFHWIAYVLGAFLALTGLKFLKRRALHPETNLLFRMVCRVIPVMHADSDDFVVRQNGRLLATPLLLSLMLVEISDLVFAIDSIPAIFAITPDPFIVFTSNIFAVLGLRAMYSLLADFLVRFRFLHVGLALVLIFVGAKMLLASVFKVSAVASLVTVVVLIAGSAMVSVLASGSQWRASPANAETPRAQKL